MKVYTGQSIKKIEEACFAAGITELRLMENAGVACAKVIRKEYDLENNPGKRVVVLCGKGKNGGDGFVIARKLHEIGAVPTIILTHDVPHIHEPKEMLHRAQFLDIPSFLWADFPQRASECVQNADIVVDCIFGIGYHGAADERTRGIFACFNSTPAKRVSIDVPSGLDSEGEDYDSGHITADLCVCISALKPVHVRDVTANFCGKIVVVGINIEPRFFALEEPVAEITDGKLVASLLPPRAEDANKGTFGHLLMVCGSYRMPGAAVMSALAAERSGTGKITLAFPAPAYAAVTSKLNEPLFLPLAADETGFFDIAARDALMPELAGKSAVLIGCGIGQSLGGLALLETVMKRCKGTVLVDADGINLLAENIYLLEEREAPTVLTPHLGEFARLMGKPIEKIKANRALYAQAFCEKYPQAVLVLKGKNTLIARQGEMLYINPTGNAGLAQGGTGDVLAGFMAGLIAQGIAPLSSAVIACYVHGEAGEMCAERLSQRGMTTLDLAHELPFSFKKYCRE